MLQATLDAKINFINKHRALCEKVFACLFTNQRLLKIDGAKELVRLAYKELRYSVTIAQKVSK